MLVEVKDQLEAEKLPFLQELAFNEQNYKLAAELGSTCYQLLPTQEIALRNAEAFAHLNDAQNAGGWLQNAIEFGNLSLEKIVQESVFDNVRDNPEFKTFFHLK